MMVELYKTNSPLKCDTCKKWIRNPPRKNSKKCKCPKELAPSDPYNCGPDYFKRYF